jgi:hypothetical protein
LVVAQSNSEIPEGLMNNSVFCIAHMCTAGFSHVPDLIILSKYKL